MHAAQKLIVDTASGARFFRADLHIHSVGASHDVTDTSMTPTQIVATAVAENLDLIAITDHNEISNVATAIAASAGTSVTALPGVELSTLQGHLLAYFPDFPSLSQFFGKLDLQDRGTKQSRCDTSMLECLNLVGRYGGIAVLAHVDLPDGFDSKIPGNPPQKVDILCHPALLGFEVKHSMSPQRYGPDDTDAQRCKAGQDRIQRLALGPRTKLARVQFSDSHNLATLGKNASGDKKVTRLKMDTPGFPGLKTALLDSEARVRLEAEVPRSIPRVRGIAITGGFLDGQVVHFSSNLNCIIGGRGAGKSTIVECIRATLATTPPCSTVVDSEDVGPDNLGVAWTDEVGETFLIERTRMGDASVTGRPDLSPATFEIDCFGQGETARTSVDARTNPLALLRYLDRYSQVGEHMAEDAALRHAIAQCYERIVKLQEDVGQIPAHDQSLTRVQGQLKLLKEQGGKEAIELEQAIETSKRTRQGAIAGIAEIPDFFDSTSVDAACDEIVRLLGDTTLAVGNVQADSIRTLVDLFKADAKTILTTLAASAKALVVNANLAANQWMLDEQANAEKLKKAKQDFQDNGVKLDTAIITRLTTEESRLTKALLKLRESEVKQKLELKERQRLWSERKRVLQVIETTRVAFASLSTVRLDQSLEGMKISLKYQGGRLSPDACAAIRDAMGWRTSQVPRAELLVREIGVQRLRELGGAADAVAEGEVLAVRDDQGNAVFVSSQAAEVVAKLKTFTLRRALECAEIHDLPKLSASRGAAGKLTSRPFDRLSLGQQQSVLLSLMLCSDFTTPLVIDQPEDNLDAEFIANSLVGVLRFAKERRQIIIATHNANIAVLGDSELIVALKSTNEKSSIVARGSIDSVATRAAACRILEGSEEAFRLRSTIYGVV